MTLWSHGLLMWKERLDKRQVVPGPGVALTLREMVCEGKGSNCSYLLEEWVWEGGRG